MQGGVAQDGFEAAEGRQVLGGAARNESRAVAELPELDREGPQKLAREAFEKVRESQAR